MLIPLHQLLSTLKPAAQKLACMYAFVGGDMSDDDKLQLSVHGECMMGELPLLTAELVRADIVVAEAATHFAPGHEHIRPRHYGDVMTYVLTAHPEWLHELATWPLTRYPEFADLRKAILRLHAGEPAQPMVFSSAMPPYMVGLAHDVRYSTLISMIRDNDFAAFATAVITRWMRMDYVDTVGIMRRQMSLRKLDASDPDIRQLRSLMAYYDYVCMGTYQPPTGIRLNYYDLLLKGVHAVTQGKAELALKVMAEATQARSQATARGSAAAATYIGDGIAAFYWVIALWTSHRPDTRRQLAAFATYVRQQRLRSTGAAALLADTLAHTHQRVDMDMLTTLLSPIAFADKEYVLQQRMAQFLGASLSGMPIQPDVFQPCSAFLRHEAQAYITMTKGEKKQLAAAFGAKPISAFAHVKEPWEQMVDRLIAAETQRLGGDSVAEHRVMYIIMSDGESIDIREQNRLKDGRWGSGKQLPWNRFISGTEPFMDRTDQAIVADVRYHQASRLTLGLILPHLAGTDRVYTGEQTPYRRVVIERQEPYVIVERNTDGFHVQSNIAYRDLLSPTNVYHKADGQHYIYYPMSRHAREVLQQLLSVSDFPPRAEERLQQALTLVQGIVDIHSDLLPAEQELQTLEPQTTLLMRITPDPTSQTLFDVYLLVRPLLGGHMVVTPAQGERTIIDQTATRSRVRIERDMEGEAAHLQELTAYCLDHDIAFSTSLSAHLTTPQVLDLLAYANQHPDSCTVEWPEGERLRMRRAPAGGWQLSLTPRGRWFEVEGQVRLNDNSILTAQQLLAALAGSHGGYVQLAAGDYLWLSERLRRQLDAVESLTTMQNNRPMVSALQSGLLGELVNGEVSIHHEQQLRDLQQRMLEADRLEAQVPEALQATLRPYQAEGYRWLVRLASWGAGACLADDMGLGKTVQTIAFLLEKAAGGASLVVAPASVLPGWRNELARFAPTLHTVTLGEQADRAEAVRMAKAGDVVLATYGLMVPTADIMAAKEWNVVCLDEAHTIKNRGTKTSAACMQLNAKARLILTGTPVQNHLGELWNLFQFINPGLLGTYEQFAQKYINPIEVAGDSERQEQLQALVAPFMLRRTKQAVVTELPAKTEINIQVELTDDEMAFYEVIRREAEQRFNDEARQLNINTLAELTRLRRAACAPELIDHTWTAGSSKVSTFLELAGQVVDGGHSVLVFSQFTSFLQLAAKALDDAAIAYLYLDGQASSSRREQLVADFQNHRAPVFLISLKAGGVGLNLTAANYVIHLDPWWNPAIEQQATDRAYRIGQQQAVTVYHLISHHTIEEKILRLHESKRALSDSLLAGADRAHRLTATDMLALLSNQW